MNVKSCFRTAQPQDLSFLFFLHSTLALDPNATAAGTECIWKVEITSRVRERSAISSRSFSVCWDWAHMASGRELYVVEGKQSGDLLRRACPSSDSESAMLTDWLY